jgi:hypothetical protein
MDVALFAALAVAGWALYAAERYRRKRDEDRAEADRPEVAPVTVEDWNEKLARRRALGLGRVYVRSHGRSRPVARIAPMAPDTNGGRRASLPGRSRVARGSGDGSARGVIL